MKNRLQILFLTILLLPCSLPAVIENYAFDNDEQRLRFQQLTNDLRCPKCQNQNIADSNAPIAADLRREIHHMLLARRSDDEIIDFMSSRYGDFVLYKPRLSAQTVFLWFGPPALMLLGLIIAGLLIRYYRHARKTPENACADLTPEQQQRLAALLKAHQETPK